MEHLDFILWMLLFPICMSLQDYISAKKRQLTNESEKQYSKDTEGYAALFFVVLWFFVGYHLF